jgi:signal transduction histidine kinase
VTGFSQNVFPSEEQSVQRAEQDWMRQMFSGTIHNIGNVITVARLAVAELEEANAEKKEVLKVILDEILPQLDQHSEAGTIGEFLTSDPEGSHFIASICKLLEHQKSILDEQQETVTALNLKLNHITEIINLQQRLVSGVGHQEVVPYSHLVKDAVKMMGESANRHGVRVELDIQEDGYVDVDPSMMTQVLINFLKNSIEALDELVDRERNLQISTFRCLHGDEPCVACRFKDNGPGIDPDNLKKIFEFGFTTKQSEGYGRGVGLNYCRSTIEKFNGDLDVESSPGKGTTFTVWLKEAEDED